MAHVRRTGVARANVSRASVRLAGAPLAVAALVVAVPAIAPRAEVAIRVRLESGAGSVELAGKALRVEGQPVQGEETVVVPASGGRLRAGEIVRRGALRFEAPHGLRVSGKPVPGSVTVLAAREGLDVINVVPLEEYVERVVASEIYPSWPMEALKAQAVVTRTYALYSRERSRKAPFDVESSVLSQRYVVGWVPARVREATGAAAGEFLSYGGVPIFAAFHMAAGGRTAAAEEVWGERLSYLQPVDSPDEDCPDHFWSYEIALSDLRAALADVGVDPGNGAGVEIVERTPSGRVAAVRIGEAVLSGHDLREVLGGRAIRSALFDVRLRDDAALFLGSGAGHGVGLSQWGARRMALDGRSYREILGHYYPGTSLGRLEGSDLPLRPAGARR